jgi:hypothetical protein
VAEASQLKARVFASPFVPAASVSQQLALDIDVWSKALADPTVRPTPRNPVSFAVAGAALRDLLTFVVQQAAQTPSDVSKTTLSTHSSKLPQAAMISGCTIVRNAVQLRYPLMESIASYAPVCDEIVICWDPTSTDDTRGELERIRGLFPNVKLVESKWNLDNRDGGTELARQTQIAFGHCSRPWTLYIQADEALHEADHQLIQSWVQDDRLAGIGFRRKSFLRTLDAEIIAQRSEGLFRLFRTGLGASIGDAMHCQVHANGRKLLMSPCTIFNYSRLGTDHEVNNRSENLNRFYHEDDYIRALDARADHSTR